MKNFTMNNIKKSDTLLLIKSSIIQKIVFVVFLFSNLVAFSQNAKLVNVNDLLKNKSITENNLNNSETIVKIKNLLYNLNASVYVFNGEMNLKSDFPVCMYTDYTSLNLISNVKFSKDAVEFVSVRIKSIKDFNSPIDLNIFNEFKSLKYILFVFENNVSESQLSNVIKNPKDKHTYIYVVEKPS